MANRKESNLKKLEEADELQRKTKEAIFRIQKNAAEAEALGVQTLEEVIRQGHQMDDVHSELRAVDTKLDTTKSLLGSFDRWAFNWLGKTKNKAMKEAAAEIFLRDQEVHSKVNETFEHQKYDVIKGTWRNEGLVLCSDTGIRCDDLFDPKIQKSIEDSHWHVDFTLTSIDGDGWTYSFDFATLNKTGAGDDSKKWNSCVRRRKWRYVDKNGSVGVGLHEIKDRQEARKNKTAVTASSKNTDKIGYVPRNKQAAELKASGLVSSRMSGKTHTSDQDLDDESAAGLNKLKENDAEIDAGIDAISRTIDNLSGIAATMKEETQCQNQKLEKINDLMDITTQKGTVVNARLREHLKK